MHGGVNKQEAEQRFTKVKQEYERLFNIFREYKKAHLSGEMNEQEYKEKVASIIQQQNALKKEYVHMNHIVIFGYHPEYPQSV